MSSVAKVFEATGARETVWNVFGVVSRVKAAWDVGTYALPICRAVLAMSEQRLDNVFRSIARALGEWT